MTVRDKRGVAHLFDCFTYGGVVAFAREAMRIWPGSPIRYMLAIVALTLGCGYIGAMYIAGAYTWRDCAILGLWMIAAITAGELRVRARDGTLDTERGHTYRDFPVDRDDTNSVPIVSATAASASNNKSEKSGNAQNE